MTKQCSKCLEHKVHNEFYKVRVRAEIYLRGECKECSKKRASAGKRNQRRIDPRYEMLVAARIRARRRGVPCTIWKEDITIPLVCPILGITLRKKIGRGPSLSSPSLDEIVPGIGYVPGNVLVVSHKANTMKSNGSLDDLVRIGKWAESRLTNHK